MTPSQQLKEKLIAVIVEKVHEVLSHPISRKVEDYRIKVKQVVADESSRALDQIEASAREEGKEFVRRSVCEPELAKAREEGRAEGLKEAYNVAENYKIDQDDCAKSVKTKWGIVRELKYLLSPEPSKK